jgi:hypothetical protein
MLSGQTPPKLSYIGPHSESADISPQINSYEEFLCVIRDEVKLNLEIDIKITCINVCDFKFSPNFFKEVIEEESSVSDIIDDLNSSITKNDIYNLLK